MSPRRTEFFRRVGRWAGAAALVTLMPKCLLCVLGYAGLGAALGLGGPELCGAGTESSLRGWLRSRGLGVACGVVGCLWLSDRLPARA
jgi:hypothetical protein